MLEIIYIIGIIFYTDKYVLLPTFFSQRRKPVLKDQRFNLSLERKKFTNVSSRDLVALIFLYHVEYFFQVCIEEDLDDL